jgi:type 1 glutamine amidotransferase
LSGGIFHPFEESSAELARQLDAVGVQSDITEDIEAGLEALASGTRYELLTVNALRWRMAGEKYDEYRDQWRFELSPRGRRAIRDHVANGGGMLAVHTASICFDGWEDWGQILGGAWVWGKSNHPEFGAVDVQIAGPHCIVEGARDFRVDDEIYHHLAMQSDVVPLLSAERDEGAQPLLWARSFGRGRVVYDALGHDAASIAQPQHAQILKRAALWALSRRDQEVREI